jgi:hypothetical protein
VTANLDSKPESPRKRGRDGRGLGNSNRRSPWLRLAPSLAPKMARTPVPSRRSLAKRFKSRNSSNLESFGFLLTDLGIWLAARARPPAAQRRQAPHSFRQSLRHLGSHRASRGWRLHAPRNQW